MKNFDFTFNYCPACGAKASVKQLNNTHHQCEQCQMNFWNNPVTAVGVIMLKDDKMLVGKRNIEPLKGKYDYPGGFLEYGENPYDAAVREVKEETGVTIKNPTFIFLGTHEYMPGVTTVDILMATTEWSGDLQAADDVAALEWKPIDILNSPDFAWDWPGLANAIAAFQRSQSSA